MFIQVFSHAEHSAITRLSSVSDRSGNKNYVRGLALALRSHIAAILAVAYVFVEIPLFALVYAHCRTDFYVATAYREPGMALEAEALLDSLRTSIGPSVQRHIERRTSGTVRQLYFSDLKSGSSRVSFVAHPYVERQPWPEGSERGFPLYRLELDWSHGLPTISKDSTFPEYGRGEMLLELGIRRIPSLFDRDLDTSPSEIFVAPAPQDLFSRLWVWVEQANGTPRDRGWDAAVRWTYLSVVCITTLGLGDVVPTTTRARFLVSLEAIIGIVTAGLFLNSVVRRRGGDRS